MTMDILGMKKIFTIFFAALTLVFSVGCGTNATTNNKPAADSNEFLIVTSFFPVYVDVANITKGIDGVRVVNMTQPQTGCLHDYRLTADDMRLLATADAFVINGGGMENFLANVAKELPNLTVIDAAKTERIVMLKDTDGDNPHVWMSITYALAQVKEITARLCEVDAAHADAYRKNALDYCMALEKLREEMHAELDDLPNKDVVTFHEAFPYFAREFKLNVVGVIEHEPGEDPSPKEIAAIVQTVNNLSTKVLFTEPQYSPTAAETIAAETGAKIYTLDPIVTGDADETALNAYCERMRQNAATLKAALGQ